MSRCRGTRGRHPLRTRVRNSDRGTGESGTRPGARCYDPAARTRALAKFGPQQQQTTIICNATAATAMYHATRGGTRHPRRAPAPPRRRCAAPSWRAAGWCCRSPGTCSGDEHHTRGDEVPRHDAHARCRPPACGSARTRGSPPARSGEQREQARRHADPGLHGEPHALGLSGHQFCPATGATANRATTGMKPAWITRMPMPARLGSRPERPAIE